MYRRRNFAGEPALLLLQTMLLLFQLLAVLVLVAISLVGFAAAVAWTLAIWFDHPN